MVRYASRKAVSHARFSLLRCQNGFLTHLLSRNHAHAHRHYRLLRQLVLLVFCHLLLAIVVPKSGFAGEIIPYELVGVVTSAPNRVDGYGVWQVDVAGVGMYVLVADPERTFFQSIVPQSGNEVYVKVSPSPHGVDEIISIMVVDLVTTIQPTDTTTMAFVTFSGSVLNRPATESGIGRWQIFTRSGRIYTVDVHDDDAFTRGRPSKGQDIYVRGWRMAAQAVSAETIEIDDGSVHDEPAEQAVFTLAGEVVGEPTATATGQLWHIRDNAMIYLIRTNGESRMPAMAPGTYVHLLAVEEDADPPLLALEVTVNTFAAGEILVRLQPDIAVATVAEHYQLVPDQTVLASGNIHRLLSPNPTADYLAYVVAQMQLDPAVIWAELNYLNKLPLEGHPHRLWGWGGQDDSSYVNQAAFTQIKLGNVHESYRGDGQIVAVLDTGIDLEHPALQAQLLAGWDMVDDDPLPDDEGPGAAQGHGTHISGIVARVAPGSRILPVRVLDPDGRGDTFIVAYAIVWAIEQGADVINLSLGTQEDSPLFHDVLHWAAQQGVSVIAAAGNSNSSALHYPAAYPDIVAVTAVGETKAKAPFANYGSWIDLAAPGVGITSTIVTAQGSGYATWSGTSMATPFVSGAIALLRQKFPEKQLRELHQRLQTRSEVIDEQNMPYPGLLGTFLNVEAAMAEDVVSPFNFALYVPLVIAIDPTPLGKLSVKE